MMFRQAQHTNKQGLPKGWRNEKLKDACLVFADGDWIETKNQSPEGIRLVQTGNIGFGFFKNKEDKSRFISEETFNELKCTEILPGDLLVSRLPDPVGKSCIIPDLNTKMITGVDCTIIRPKDYLFSELLSESFSELLLPADGSSDIPFLKLLIPLARSPMMLDIFPFPKRITTKIAIIIIPVQPIFPIWKLYTINLLKYICLFFFFWCFFYRLINIFINIVFFFE